MEETLSTKDEYVLFKANKIKRHRFKCGDLHTGYTFEEIINEIDINNGWKELLYATDILIDENLI